MISRAGFSLPELLIALALSSVIMLGLVQANKNAAYLLKEAQNLLVVNRQVALLYNQLERDITGCLVYAKAVPYAPAKEAAKKQSESVQPTQSPQSEPQKSESQKPEAEKKEKEKYVPSCVLEPYEDGAYRVGSKKWQQTKKFSIITTTPLDVYEQDHARWVRVGYELVYDKKMSTPQKNVYVLYRLQTDVIENALFKSDEDSKKPTISRCVVACNVKQFSLEAVYDKRPPEKKGEQQDVPASGDIEQLKTFTWTEKEEKEKSATVLPDHFAMHIELWDTPLDRSYSFSCIAPVFVKTKAGALKKTQNQNVSDQPIPVEGAPAEKTAAVEPEQQHEEIANA
jgi:prepilin-type N-terminal cleavage/methylation domain-containing protein